MGGTLIDTPALPIDVVDLHRWPIAGLLVDDVRLEDDWHGQSTMGPAPADHPSQDAIGGGVNVHNQGRPLDSVFSGSRVHGGACKGTFQHAYRGTLAAQSCKSGGITWAVEPSKRTRRFLSTLLARLPAIERRKKTHRHSRS